MKRDTRMKVDMALEDWQQAVINLERAQAVERKTKMALADALDRLESSKPWKEDMAASVQVKLTSSSAELWIAGVRVRSDLGTSSAEQLTPIAQELIRKLTA